MELFCVLKVVNSVLFCFRGADDTHLRLTQEVFAICQSWAHAAVPPEVATAVFPTAEEKRSKEDTTTEL